MTAHYSDYIPQMAELVEKIRNTEHKRNYTEKIGKLLRTEVKGPVAGGLVGLIGGALVLGPIGGVVGGLAGAYVGAGDLRSGVRDLARGGWEVTRGVAKGVFELGKFGYKIYSDERERRGRKTGNNSDLGVSKPADDDIGFDKTNGPIYESQFDLHDEGWDDSGF